MFYKISDSDGWPILNNNNIIVADETCSTEIMHYPYPVKCAFEKPEELIDAAKWAEDICVGPWLIGCVTSGFLRQEDALHFKLRCA